MASVGNAGAVTVLKEHLMRHPSDRDTLQALISFSRDAGNFAVALEYAEQLARVAPNDPSLTLIDNLRRQIRMHEDGEPLPATDKFVGCVSCVSDGYAAATSSTSILSFPTVACAGARGLCQRGHSDHAAARSAFTTKGNIDADGPEE